MTGKKHDWETTSANEPDPRSYVVGGGIAAMAAAAFMIRDGDVIGSNITLFEQRNAPGGSLDGRFIGQAAAQMVSRARRGVPAG